LGQKTAGFDGLETDAMASADDAKQRLQDADEHRKSYDGIMKNSALVGVPLTMGLAMFFTQLVMGNGWWAPLWFVATYLFVWWVAKTFFSSH
jgi:Flp pilus assembly protein TadB